MIKLIVGLGNPGVQYEKTRHNAGFLFLDGLADRFGAKWSASSQFQGQLAALNVSGRKLWLLKPMVFMNRSGASVGSLARFYKIDAENLLVVHDELDLPSAVVKMKHDGGHAGHNGLRDVIAQIGARNFCRMRIGIGRPSEGCAVSDYVLSPFAKNERDLLLDLFDDVMARGLERLLEGDVLGFNSLFAQIKS